MYQLFKSFSKTNTGALSMAIVTLAFNSCPHFPFLRYLCFLMAQLLSIILHVSLQGFPQHSSQGKGSDDELAQLLLLQKGLFLPYFQRTICQASWLIVFYLQHFDYINPWPLDLNVHEKSTSKLVKAPLYLTGLFFSAFKILSLGLNYDESQCRPL